MQQFKVVTVPLGQMESTLNDLVANGWDVHQIHIENGQATIVAHRNVEAPPQQQAPEDGGGGGTQVPGT